MFNSRRVDVTKIEMLDRSFTDVALAATVALDNPGDESLALDTATWTLNSGRRTILEGSNPYRVALLPGESRNASVPVAFHLPDLYREAPELRGQRQLSYDLTLTLADSSNPDAQRIVARTRGVLDVEPSPTIELRTVTVEQQSYRSATIRVDVALVPVGGERQELRGIVCDVALDGRPVLEARMDSITLPLDQPKVLPLTADIELGRENEATARILQRDTVRYRLSGYAAIAGNWPGVLRLPLNDSGTIALTHAAR